MSVLIIFCVFYFTLLGVWVVQIISIPFFSELDLYIKHYDYGYDYDHDNYILEALIQTLIKDEKVYLSHSLGM